MKTSLKLILSIVAIAAFVLACSSNDDTAQMMDDDVSVTDDVDPTDDDPMDDDPDDGTMGTSDGQIVFPDGVEIDLTGATITIAGEIIAVTDLENTELPKFEGASELAFLTDAEGNILLAGFIDANRNHLSVASTATVLFYFATTGYLQAEEFKDEILTGIEESEPYASFTDQLETLFVADNLVVKNLGFLEALETSISSIKTIPTVNNAIFVESNDIRSKLQLINAGEDNDFMVKNKGPRRAALFAYKKAFTDMDDNRTVLIENVGSTDVSIYSEPQFLLNGTFNSNKFPDNQITQGNRFAAALSCGIIFVETNSEPFQLALEDSESTAEFEISIIGPGKNQGERSMTTAERQAFEQISEETFFLDYLLPTLFDIAGRKQAYNGINEDTKKAPLINAMRPYFDNNPDVKEMVFNGNYAEALLAFFENTRSDTSLFRLLEDAYVIVLEDNDISGQDVFSDTLIENLVDMTEIITAVTNRLSLFCTDEQLDDISTLESWEITADRGEVSLEPLRGGVQTLEDLEITADIEGLEEEELSNGSITYEWTVSENFSSILRDDQGNNGVTFTNTTNKVTFQSSASVNDLVGFENLETVTVRAFQNNNGSQVLIGTAEMTVNVQERRFVIDPLDVILCGIEQANLRVLNEEDNTPLQVNDDFDFRLVWTTDGSHALFNGNSTSETVVNENGIVLRNLDDEVENATQQVRVGIWLRPKDNPNDIPFREAGFEFVDVYISNNNTIEFEVAAAKYIAFSAPEGNGTRILFGGGFLIPREERAIGYQAEIIEYFFDGQLVESLSGEVFTWTNQSQGGPVDVANFVDNTFVIGFNAASVNTTANQYPERQRQFNGVSGRAKITITLDK